MNFTEGEWHSSFICWQAAALLPKLLSEKSLQVQVTCQVFKDKVLVAVHV
jgi:hypothetical protein